MTVPSASAVSSVFESLEYDADMVTELCAYYFSELGQRIEFAKKLGHKLCMGCGPNNISSLCVQTNTPNIYRDLMELQATEVQLYRYDNMFISHLFRITFTISLFLFRALLFPIIYYKPNYNSVFITSQF